MEVTVKKSDIGFLMQLETDGNEKKRSSVDFAFGQIQDLTLLHSKFNSKFDKTLRSLEFLM